MQDMEGSRFLQNGKTTFLGAFTKLRKSSISFVMSGHLSTLNNTDPPGRIFIKFDISVFLENLLKKFSFIKICQK